jgi:hypothetical protein
MSASDLDEANYLLNNEGEIDTTVEGRKLAKKLTQELKKAAAASAEKAKKEIAHTKKSKEKDKEKDKDGKAVKVTKKVKVDNLKKKQEQKVKEREDKKETRDIEKRRARRRKEREKALKGEAKKSKKRRSSIDGDDAENGLSRDKRVRATAIVNGYLSRMSHDAEYKGLANSGVMAIPAAMVESTSLLGMALAFRAAAGVMPMPDHTKEDVKKYKPWLSINADRPLTSTRRETYLESQIELIRKQIVRVRNNTARRRKIWAELAPQLSKKRQQIAADEQAARQNPYKKRKKTPAKSEGVDDDRSRASGRKSTGASSLMSKLETDGSDEEVDGEATEYPGSHHGFEVASAMDDGDSGV